MFASAGTELVLGFPANEFIGRNVLERIHPDDVEHVVVQMAGSSDGGVSPGITRFRVQHADGSWRPIEVLGSEVTDGAENLIGVYARDGQHQVFLEEVLTLLLSGASRAESLAPVCNVIQWHQVGSHLSIGYRDEIGFRHVTTGVPEELSGAELAGDDHVDPWSRCRNLLKTVEGTAADLDDRRRSLAEEYRVGPYWIEPVVWSGDLPPATVTIWTADTGDRSPTVHSYGMGAARYLVELIMRWTQQGVELERANRRLLAQEKLASLGTLTAGVAHEVRNPLNFIKNFAEAGRETVADLRSALDAAESDRSEIDELTEDLQTDLGLIGKHVTRIDSIVANMLGYSQGRVGPSEWTNIGELVATFVDLGYQGYRGSDHAEFSAELRIEGPDELLALVHPQEIGRVIINLVSNACDAINDVVQGGGLRAPQLFVRVDQVGNRVRIAVQDNGTGISPEDQKHVFEPFTTTKDPGKGTGLGLSLCYDIVVGLHGGELSLESDLDVGSTFTVEVPIEGVDGG